MASLNTLREGQVLYTVTKQSIGNTTMTRNAVHRVKVVNVDMAARKVVASWNGNAEKAFSESQVAKWKVSKPPTRPLMH